MDPSSEALIRASIHDMANILSGLRGILELMEPGQPFSAQTRARMDAVLTEGLASLDRTRHLAMGTLPEALMESSQDWRTQLEMRLEPMAAIFHQSFRITAQGDASHDRWPGELLRGYTMAVTRQVLPYAQGTSVEIQGISDHRGWHIHWSPISLLPEGLNAPPSDRPTDITTRWALQVGHALGASLSFESNVVRAFIPRF